MITFFQQFLFFAAIVFGTPSQNSGPIAHWAFDEGRGNVVKNLSGSDHAGQIKGAKWVDGRDGKALSFEDGGYVEIPDHPALRLEGDFTIAAWIMKSRRSEKGKSMGIVSKSGKDVWDYDLFMSTSNLEHPAFYSDAFKGPGGDIEVISASPVSLNKWHHIAVTRRGHQAEIFVDGVMTGTATLPEKLSTSNRNLFIGYDHDGGFAGVIDDVRIYDRALQKDEIRALANPQTTFKFNHIVIDPSFGGIRAVADINGDSQPDFVHAYWYDSAPMSWYEARPDGRWQRHVIRENFYPVTDNFDVADMNGDNYADIVMASSASKRSSDPKADNVVIDKVDIVWFENPGPKQASRSSDWKQHLIGSHTDANENYVKDIKAVDFTRDGKRDVVIRSNVAISVFVQSTDGRWNRVLYRAIHPHEGMDTGDVDCDGDPDIVLNGFWLECPMDPSNDNWSQHVIDEKWFTQSGDWTANNCKVYVEDMDGDGCADVLLSHSERAGYPVVWYKRDTSKPGAWLENVIGTVDFCHTLQAADMDLDGDIDVITGEMEKSDDPDQIVVFLNDKNGKEWTNKVTIDTPIYSGKVADLDGDGDLDILGNRNFNKPPIEMWENLKLDK